jgi:hypothetical protein
LRRRDGAAVLGRLWQVSAGLGGCDRMTRGFVLEVLIVGREGGTPRSQGAKDGKVGGFVLLWRARLVRLGALGVSARNASCKLGHSGTFWDIGPGRRERWERGEPQRHRDTKGRESAREDWIDPL